MTRKELKIVKDLDDGTLYADPEIVAEIMGFPGCKDCQLLVSRTENGDVNGCLPVCRTSGCSIFSYIPTPPVSPTYPPGAANVFNQMSVRLFDNDIRPDEKKIKDIYSQKQVRYFDNGVKRGQSKIYGSLS